MTYPIIQNTGLSVAATTQAQTFAVPLSAGGNATRRVRLVAGDDICFARFGGSSVAATANDILVDTVPSFLTVNNLTHFSVIGRTNTRTSNLLFAGIAVTDPGAYTTSVPSLTLTGGGTGAGGLTLVSVNATGGTGIATAGSGYVLGGLVSATGDTGTEPTWSIASTGFRTGTVGAAGSGYTPGDQLTLTGGTFSTAGVASLSTTLLVTAAPIAAGSGYLFNDSVTLAGGTASTTAIASVSQVQLVSVQATTAGTGYIPGDLVYYSGGTQVGTNFAATKVAQVGIATSGASIYATGTGYPKSATLTATLTGGTSSTAGVIGILTDIYGRATGVSSITTAGNYSVIPSNPVAATTSATVGSGLQFDLNWGIVTSATTALTIAAGGIYTTSTTSPTQSGTSGAGSGAAFASALYGVHATTITTAGSYTTNGATLTQGGTTGAGTGATYLGKYGVLTYGVATAGTYTGLPSPTTGVSGGTGTGATLVPNIDIPQSLTLANAGSCSAIAANPHATSSTAGTGLYANITWGVSGASVTNAGALTASIPTATFSTGLATGTAIMSTGATFNITPMET